MGQWSARATALAALCLLAACAGQRIAVRAHDAGALAALPASWRFERAELAAAPGVAAAQAANDAALRAALERALTARGYRHAADDGSAALLLDYGVLDQLSANAKRLDSPTDYQRSWHEPGISQDGTGAMDHAVADAAFGRELSLTVLLRAADTRALLWEARASRVLAADAAVGAAFASVAKDVAAELPRR